VIKKYFVCSDIHSNFTALKKALEDASFDINNKNHILVIAGDVFDRGKEAIDLYNFIISIPKNRRILIRGNHELLFLQLLDKFIPDEYDYSNGTVSTFIQIAMDSDPNFLKNNKTLSFKDLKDIVIKSNIYQFIKLDEWVDYALINKYLITHASIPLSLEEHILNNTNYHPLRRDWDDCIWENPIFNYKMGIYDNLINKGYTLVVGHYFANLFHEEFDNEFDNDNTYFGKGIIALDGSSYTSNHINIFVIDKNITK